MMTKTQPTVPSWQPQKVPLHLFLLLSFIIFFGAAVTNVAAFTNTLPGRNKSHNIGNLPPKTNIASSFLHHPHHHKKLFIKASSTTTFLSVSNSNNDETDKKDEELTLERIAELIEVSFVNACMQLATGYVDVLKLFVTSVKAAYERSATIPTLQSSLKSCPNQSANRPLMKEEDELRFIWMQLIYLTLQEVEYYKDYCSEDVGNSVSEDVRDKYQDIVHAVVNKTLQRNGNDSKTTEQEQQQKQQQGQNHVPLGSSPLVKLEDLPFDIVKDFGDNDPMAKALLAQSVRVIGVTLAVLEEEERCFGDGMGGGASSSSSSGASPPKPPIPGAF